MIYLKDRITEILTSSVPITIIKKKHKETEEIHFSFTLDVKLHLSAGVMLILPCIKAQRVDLYFSSEE